MEFIKILIGVLIVDVIVTLLTAIMLITRPTTKEVYQGKTTLEYTVIDGVKVDSTVVYKEKVK